jgi:hypothetical protein
MGERLNYIETEMRKLFVFTALLTINSWVFAQPGKITPKTLKPFIPANYAILKYETGDLNQDTYPDVVLVLKYNHEADSDQAARPLLILLGKKGGSLSLYARNDSVVMCKGCGGVFGDPFDGITVKGRYFSLEYYGGSRYRWNRFTTFKYDAVEKDFILHKDAGLSYDDVQKHAKYTKDVYHKEQFDKQRFVKYNYDTD